VFKKITPVPWSPHALPLCPQASEERRELARQLGAVESELSEQRRSAAVGRDELQCAHAALRSAHASLAAREAAARDAAKHRDEREALREAKHAAEQAALALEDELRNAGAERQEWAAERDALMVRPDLLPLQIFVRALSLSLCTYCLRLHRCLSWLHSMSAACDRFPVCHSAYLSIVAALPTVLLAANVLP
jgi:hypothetical protein